MTKEMHTETEKKPLKKIYNFVLGSKRERCFVLQINLVKNI